MTLTVQSRAMVFQNPHHGETLGELSLPALNVRTEALAAISRAKAKVSEGRVRSRSAGSLERCEDCHFDVEHRRSFEHLWMAR